MRKKPIILITLSCLLINILNIPILFADEKSKSGKTTVAVMNLEAKDVSQSEADTVSDFLRYDLLNTGKFDVIERTSMEKILAEQKLQLTGCTSTECAIEIGKLLNARKIIIGTVSKLGTNYFITGRIVDIETGKVEVSERAKCAGLEELEIGSKLIAYKFAGIQPDEKVLKGDAKLVMQQEEQPKVAPVTPTYQPYVESPSTPQPYMESSSGSMSWLNWTGIIAGSTLGILGLVTASTADEKASGYYTDYLAATSVSDAEYYHGRVEYYDKQVATDKTIAAVGFATAGLFIIIEILSSGDSTTNRASNVSENFRVSIAPEKSGLRITNEWTF